MSEHSDDDGHDIVLLPRSERLPWLALCAAAVVAVAIAAFGAWHAQDSTPIPSQRSAPVVEVVS